NAADDRLNARRADRELLEWLLPGRDGQPEARIGIAARGDRELRRGASHPREVAEGFVHHLRDRIAPVLHLAVVDRARHDQRAAAGRCSVGVIRSELRDLEAVERADDADRIRVEDLTRFGVDLLADRADIPAEHPAAEVVRIRAAKQAEQHLVAFAELLQQADRLQAAALVSLTVGLRHRLDADFNANAVVIRGRAYHRAVAAVAHSAAGDRALDADPVPDPFLPIDEHTQQRMRLLAGQRRVRE